MMSLRSTTSSRISYIALTTPALRSILIRALHNTPSINGGGPRTSQPGRPSRDRYSRSESSRPSYGSKLSFGNGPSSSPRPSFGVKPSFGKNPTFGSRDRPSFANERNQDRIPTRQNDKGRIAPTSSRRLMSFDQPPPRRSARPSPREDADEDTERTPSPRFPKSQPFQPPTYASTPTLSDAAEAAPKIFDSFDLTPGLLEALTSQFGLEGKTTPIQSLSFSSLLSTSESAVENNEEETGRRVILGAETGSGKTMSYLVPLFQNLKATDAESPSTPSETSLHPRSIVLSPTHELTRQSTRFAKSLTHTTKLSVMGLSNTAAGGVGARRGVVDILLGTVGSVRRMLGIKKDKEEGEDDKEDIGNGLWKKEEINGLVKGDKVEWVVIDEADVLLGADFLPETLSILSTLPLSRVNLVLCTATLPPSLLNLLSSHPLFRSTSFTHLLSPGLHKLPTKLETRFVPPSKSGNRLADVAHEIRRVFADDALKSKSNSLISSENHDGDNTSKEKSKIVIFCNSDKKVEQLSRTLESKGLPCLAWTGEGQYRMRGRNGVLDEFLLKQVVPSSTRKYKQTEEEGENNISSADQSDKVEKSVPKPSTNTNPNRILITTSLLSRGLDFSPSVSSVFLLDPPRDVLDFVHRAGRAGRAGREGRVVVFGLGDGSGVGKVSDRKSKQDIGFGSRSGLRGKELQVGEVLNKRVVKRQMLGGRVKRARM